MESSPSWLVEDGLLNIYSLLAHRIKGLGWSLKDFWETDTWTTSKLYCMELDLIKLEEKELKKDTDEYHDSEEVKDLMEDMYGSEANYN